MKRVPLDIQTTTLLNAARRIVLENDAQAVVLLADAPFDFADVRKALDRIRVLVATSDNDVLEAAKQSGAIAVPLTAEARTRQMQLTQALLEAIADDLLATGDKVVALYANFEKESIDTLSVLNLGEHLARLTSRDLRRLETQVPLDTLRMVVDLAVEIGREGREAKKVGTIFVVGDHRRVLKLSHEGVHDPFKGYSRAERELSDPRVRESVKEIAQLDGAFIISADGFVISAGRILDANSGGLTLSKGLGARHWAAAAISKATNAIAIAVSQSTGTVRLFQNGQVVLRIEPMNRAMIWHDIEFDRV